jgi:three-Cys-motif partner protein
MMAAMVKIKTQLGFSISMTIHSFGGPWTLIKLDMLGRYLTFFNTALQRQPSPDRPFERIYIDAFAGTGQCEIKLTDGTRALINGSAKIAAHTDPAFHQVHLVDLNQEHVAELKILAASGSSSVIHVHQDDANSALESIASKVNWRGTRGVLFLDPYGMAVRWETLQTIAKTEALDVWYLFPLSAVYRQAAKNFEKVDEGKAAKLDAVMGTPDWRTAFYEQSKQESLLPGAVPSLRRTAGPPQIATYVHSRLSAIFKGWVSPPIFLPEVGAPMFALFFAVANPSESAVTLSKKAAEHLFSMLRNKKIGRLTSDLF